MAGSKPAEPAFADSWPSFPGVSEEECRQCLQRLDETFKDILKDFGPDDPPTNAELAEWDAQAKGGVTCFRAELDRRQQLEDARQRERELAEQAQKETVKHREQKLAEQAQEETERNSEEKQEVAMMEAIVDYLLAMD